MGAPTTAQEAVALITPEVRETYARDGVAILRQALHPEWLLLLQLGLDRVMGDSGQKKHLFYDGTENEFIELVRNTEVSPELQRFMYDSPVADMMAVLLGSPDIWLYSDEWFVKGPNGGRTDSRCGNELADQHAEDDPEDSGNDGDSPAKVLHRFPLASRVPRADAR